jgi:hypothetical protein
MRGFAMREVEISPEFHGYASCKTLKFEPGSSILPDTGPVCETGGIQTPFFCALLNHD